MTEPAPAPAPPPGGAVPAGAPGRARRGRARARAALGLASTLLALALGEVVVRVVAPQRGAFAGAQLFAPDPDTGYRNAPGVHPSARGPLVINSRGLRDVERPLERPPGVRRVLVLGDSFTFGATAVEDGLCGRLAARLGPGVDVINSGVGGWTTWQQAAWLARDGLAYAPDVVVVALFVGNDIEENLGRGALHVVDGELVPRGARPERGLVLEALNHSHLYRLLKHVPEDLWWRLQGDSRAARGYHKLERRRLALCDRGPAGAAFEPGWEATRAELARIATLARPAPVVVLVIPDEYQVDPGLVRAVCARDGTDPASFDLDRPQARLAAMCEALGLGRVDVLAELRRRTAGGEVLYLPLDSHWNAAGNDAAAAALAAHPALAALTAAARAGGAPPVTR